MRILLTGASGFIGSNVLNYMLGNSDDDLEFVCPVSFRHLGKGSRITNDERVTVLYHDLRGVMPDVGPIDTILHLASESHVDRSIKDPVPFIENNISSTLQVLEFARRVKPDIFVLFSTDEVYGPHDHNDWDVLMPSNPYAASKAAQEAMAFAYWRTYGVPVVITNSNNIVGPNQDPEKFVPKVIGLINRGERVEIHVTEKGPGRRHYNPVQNVADALLTIVKLGAIRLEVATELDAVQPLRYSLPGGEELDNLEMAQLIARLMDKPLHTHRAGVHRVRPGYDQSYAPTQGSRLVALGWKPVITLETCLKEIINA